MNKTDFYPLSTGGSPRLRRIARSGPADYLKKPDIWFAELEAKQVAATIPFLSNRIGRLAEKHRYNETRRQAGKSGPTFDNNATMNEMRFLARIHVATHDASYANAFDRGLDYIFKAQYPTGGCRSRIRRMKVITGISPSMTTRW